MADLFSIRNKLDDESGSLTARLDARRLATLAKERERIKRLVRLGVGIYFDPVAREVLRKVGSQYIFVRHDRRHSLHKDSKGEVITLKPIKGGLYWDPKEMKIYQSRGGHFVLYSRNRRQGFSGKNPTGKERRSR